MSKVFAFLLRVIYNGDDKWGGVVMNDKVALSITEAAEALGVSRSMMYQLIYREDFPAFKVGTRTLIPKKGLEEWVNKQPKSFK